MVERLSGVACHQRPWTTHTVGRRRAWHAIIAYGQHTRSNDVGHACHHCLWEAKRSNDVGRGMTSPPLDCKNGRTMSGVASHQRPWTTHTVGQRRAWHDITALGQHPRSNDVGRGMTSPPLDGTHGRQCQAWHVSPPLDSTHDRTTSSVA